MNTEQRQRIGALTAKVRDLRNEHNNAKNDLDAEILKILGEPFTKTKTEPKYDLKKIKTVQAEGPSGPYKKANNQDGNDYRLLIEDLKNHDGKITKDGLFCWLFNDKSTVGMKPSRK